MRRLLLACTLGVLFLASSAFAHHSFSKEYDQNRPVSLGGTVLKIEWVRPHPIVDVEVGRPGQARMNWKIELGDMADLTSNGWTSTSLKPGDLIAFEGWRAKDGSNRANAKSFTLPDGATLNAASSFGKEPGGQLAGGSQDATVGTTGQYLRRTASPLPLLGLIGVLLLAGGFAYRAYRS